MNRPLSYADFGFMRSIRQVKGAWGRDHRADLEVLKGSLDRDIMRIEAQLGRPLVGQRVLEIGPGQGRERAHYLGLENTVEAIDLDVVAVGWDPAVWLRMASANGPGRVAKSFGRELLVNRPARRAWLAMVGGDSQKQPISHQGDIVSWRLPAAEFDAIVSWSVFEHVADPRAAVLGVLRSLRPGGAALISIHNYTSANGHHDIRAFTGSAGKDLLWGHLRPSAADGVRPSAYLNEWRIDAWRALFDELAPGHVEYLDQYEHPEVHGPLLDGPMGAELAAYSREELLTVNVVYSLRRPDTVPEH